MCIVVSSHLFEYVVLPIMHDWQLIFEWTVLGNGKVYVFDIVRFDIRLTNSKILIQLLSYIRCFVEVKIECCYWFLKDN